MPNLTFKHLMTTASRRSARLVGVVISPSHMHCRQSQASSHPLHPIVTPQSHALSSVTGVVTPATSHRHTSVTRTVVSHRRRHTRYIPSSHLSHMHCRQSQASSHPLHPIVTPQSHALSSLTDVVTLATSRRHTAVTRTVVTHRRRHTRYAPSSHLSHMHCRQSQASSHQLRPIASVTTPARRVDSSTWLQVEVNL